MKSLLLKSNLVIKIREEADLIDLADLSRGRIQTPDKNVFPVGQVLKIHKPFLRCFLAIPRKGKLKVPTEIGIVLSAEGLIFFVYYKSAGL